MYCLFYIYAVNNNYIKYDIIIKLQFALYCNTIITYTHNIAIIYNCNNIIMLYNYDNITIMCNYSINIIFL